MKRAIKTRVVKMGAALMALICCTGCAGISGVFTDRQEVPARPAGAILFNERYDNGKPSLDLITDSIPHQYTNEGLRLTGPGQLVRLDRYYSLAKRTIRYRLKFESDTKAIFQSDKGDFKVSVDVPGKMISIGTDPVQRKPIDFLDPVHEYLLDIYHDYQTSGVRITDPATGASAEITVTQDGPGGHGDGAVQSGFYAGLQHDYYCFGLISGSAVTVRQITVVSPESDLTMLLYGDSITEPEGYFPTDDFPGSWTQLIIRHLKGRAVASGRGGTTIREVLERIKNELPYINTKYVMVTIGTNGGNTEQNLSELVEYIRSQNAIPILNNIPGNESGTQVPVNQVIEKVRQKYNIKGCKFDLATSLNGDGLKVDTTTMWLEDYDWGTIYHHPNLKGSRKMFERTLIDVPEIYR